MDRPPLGTRAWQRLQQRLRSTNLWVLDGLTATLFLVAAVVAHHVSKSVGDIEYTEPDAFSTLVTAAAAVPYYFRRHAPLPTLLVCEVCVLALTAGDYNVGLTPNLLLIGLYTVAAWCDSHDRVIGAAAMVVGLLIVAVVESPDLNGVDVVFNFVFFGGAYILGSSVRTRRLYTEQVEERAAALERERDEQARRAVADERLRIAQELHDVVAHSMGVIAVQAGVGAHVIDSDPSEAKKALGAIADTSRATLGEIRRFLGVLRESEGADYTPAPGLAELDRLVRDMGAAGVEVEVVHEGERSDLPAGVDFTAYRIVQEALTNVLKHAGAAKARVTIAYRPSALGVEIIDDGRGLNGRTSDDGHGLIGMHERVGVYGGEFRAGSRPGGGFSVKVSLPYGEID